MNARTKSTITAKTGRLEEGVQRYGLGRDTLRQTVIKAGAAIKIGKCFLINFDKMDQYMDKLTGEVCGDEK